MSSRAERIEREDMRGDGCITRADLLVVCSAGGFVLRSRLALAWVAGLLAGGCGLLIGLEDRELPAAGGPDATADVVTSDTTQPDTGGGDTSTGMDTGTPDVKVDVDAAF